MQLPFLVESSIPAVRLYELNDGRFQLLEGSSVGPFLSGPGYLLVEEKLASFLKSVGIDRVTYVPAVLFERLTGEEFRTHVRIRVGQYFKPEQIKDLDLNGPKILTMNDEYYFISAELKAMLKRSEFHYLSFSEGLNGFAG
ncbi:hypothetical protein ACO0K2_08470 [Undibacterium sp. MH2W]|uniref:hypothetical protein n=1 Tax=Undibacterium sp. MH2W TaxID=3413044 RepID=UPI003BF1DE5B